MRPFPRVQDVRTVRIRRVVDGSVPAALAARLPPPTEVTPTPEDAVTPAAPRPPEQPDDVPRWMRTAGGYSWRILAIVGVIALVVFATARIQLVFVAVFLGLVLTSVLRPLVNRLHRVMPRPLATALALLSAILFVAALVAYVVNSVASQWQSLAFQFSDGTRQILDFLENNEGRFPVTVTPEMITMWIDTGRQWVVDHSADLASNALASAGSVAEVFGALALGIFCSVFFLARGAEMWTWFLNQLPARTRETWHDAAGAGWYTFAGYARGTVIIALVDGMLAALVLVVLGVPLAAPLAVLVFIGAFIPLIGAPLAMLVAMVVALAANGLVNAVLVGVAIALIGQFEGHVLQPLVMGRQVSLHPVVVALAVTAGTLLSGILGAIVAVPLVAVAWAIYAKLHNVDPPLSAPLPTIKVTRGRAYRPVAPADGPRGDETTATESPTAARVMGPGAVQGDPIT
jgi:predicted PurR-regulated permease PerM